MLAELFPGGGFGVGEAFGIRALLSEMEEFFHVWARLAADF